MGVDGHVVRFQGLQGVEAEGLSAAVAEKSEGGEEEEEEIDISESERKLRTRPKTLSASQKDSHCTHVTGISPPPPNDCYNNEPLPDKRRGHIPLLRPWNRQELHRVEKQIIRRGPTKIHTRHLRVQARGHKNLKPTGMGSPHFRVWVVSITFHPPFNLRDIRPFLVIVGVIRAIGIHLTTQRGNSRLSRPLCTRMGHCSKSRLPWGGTLFIGSFQKRLTGLPGGQRARA